MAIINIKGFSVLVDDALAEDINPTKWEYRRSGTNVYFRTVSRVGGVRRTAWLHHIAAHCKRGQQADHRDGNTLDNRSSNLRPCSGAQNSRNRKRGRNNRSGYKGVYRAKSGGGKPWHAQIWENGRRKHLGYFATAAEAGAAYDRAATVIYGEFAKLNTPEV